MATREYMESQYYSPTLGGTVYEVTANMSTAAAASHIRKVATAADGDATPTVESVSYLLIPANTGATEITQLDSGEVNQQVTLVITSATNPSTITNAANFELSANWAPGLYDTITLFTTDGTTWIETSRSDNA